ncbi:MAG: AAA family ATPase [Halioglobus sp.]|nr:AAA family ATPase [Halioglobus sp.]
MFYFDKLDRTGGERIESMNSVVTEFNSVIESVFSEYEISASWDGGQGLPRPTIKKRCIEVPITGLSCGKSELFSLILNLYTLRDQFDIFLIDEPETHLNWHLEKLLFQYLLNFSNFYDKQLIIATHSRVVVNPDFRECVRFLFWENGSIKVTDRLPKDQREKLVEDAYEALKAGGQSHFTVFCEDEGHRCYFDALAAALISRSSLRPDVGTPLM